MKALWHAGTDTATLKGVARAMPRLPRHGMESTVPRRAMPQVARVVCS
jgi:hypothetical protein